MNVLDSARLGLDSMEHWYGLPEAMFEDRTIQHYPADYNYADEQWRFGEAGNLWQQSAEPGSPVWRDTIRELIELDFTLVPTFTIYEANRDLMRARQAEWHADYTWPALATFSSQTRICTGRIILTGPPGTRFPGDTTSTAGWHLSTTIKMPGAESQQALMRALSSRCSDLPMSAN